MLRYFRKTFQINGNIYLSIIWNRTFGRLDGFATFYRDSDTEPDMKMYTLAIGSLYIALEVFAKHDPATCETCWLNEK